GKRVEPPGRTREVRLAAVVARDGDERSPQPHGESFRVRLVSFIGTVAVLSILGIGLTSTAQTSSRIDLSLFGWIGLALIASLTTISIGEGAPVLSMDLPVLLACAFLKGPWIGGLVAFAAAIDVSELKGSISLSRAAWNHAQVSLSVIVA